MAVWKDDKVAAAALSGKVPPPPSPKNKLIIALGCGVFTLIAGVFALRSSATPMAALSTQAAKDAPAEETAGTPEKPKPKEKAETPAPKKDPPAAAPADEPVTLSKAVARPKISADVIIMPPVVLGEKSSEYGDSENARKVTSATVVVRKSVHNDDLAEASSPARMLEEAQQIEESAKGDLASLERARALYQQALEVTRGSSDFQTQCLTRLNALTSRIVLDPKVACEQPKAVFHKVEPGESVEKIARKHKVNQGQIKVLNRLNDKLMVRVGQTLKILPGDVVYRVDRTNLTGTLYIDGVYIRRYPVGIGPGDTTPVGAYVVERKLLNPDWYYEGKKIPFGDPANILGTRWMGFAVNDQGQGGGLGVHGTAFPESVPGRESKGCVRMKNEHVEELYDLMPQGGVVEILD